MVNFDFSQSIKYSGLHVCIQDLAAIRLLASIILVLLHRFLYILVIIVGILLSSSWGE
jgi:hypothetical protein